MRVTLEVSLLPLIVMTPYDLERALVAGKALNFTIWPEAKDRGWWRKIGAQLDVCPHCHQPAWISPDQLMLMRITRADAKMCMSCAAAFGKAGQLPPAIEVERIFPQFAVKRQPVPPRYRN